MVAIAFYGNGTRVLDVSDPTDIKQAGYIRIPAATGQVGNNASAAYWHNGYIYIADYSRGIDVLRYTGPIKGEVQPMVCWNSCDDSQTPAEGARRDERPGRRDRAGHAGADAGHAGGVRRVHAGRRARLHGVDDRQRHLDRGRRRC